MIKSKAPCAEDLQSSGRAFESRQGHFQACGIHVSATPGNRPESRTRLFANLPPHLHERVVCSISAAVKYEIPANIVLAVAEKEGGKPGQWVSNSDGSYDVGTMQFNTSYLRDLAPHGITAKDVAVSGCYPYDLAAWRLRGHIKNDAGDIWTRAANYHSRARQQNATYRVDLRVKARKWADWLAARFVTKDVTKTGSAAKSATVQQARTSAARATPAAHAPRDSSKYIPRKLIHKEPG